MTLALADEVAATVVAAGAIVADIVEEATFVVEDEVTFVVADEATSVAEDEDAETMDGGCSSLGILGGANAGSSSGSISVSSSTARAAELGSQAASTHSRLAASRAVNPAKIRPQVVGVCSLA